MQKSQTSFISALKFRYLPYWPLFIVLIIISVGVAYFYISITPPVYNVSATMSIKDEKKGVEDSRLLESLNIYNEKTIVENETEVLHSKTLMRDVVRNLNLYAPVSEEGRYKAASAYTISPVAIEAQNPDSIGVAGIPKVYFTYTNNTIHLGKVAYPLNEWVKTPYGVLRFMHNKWQTSQPKGKLFFSLSNVEVLANTMVLGLEVSASSKSSTIIDLSFKDEVPKRGENVLNSLIETYNMAAVKEKSKLTQNTLVVLDDRLKTVKDELTEIESRVQQFKAQNSVVDLSEQGRQYLQNVGLNDQKVTDIGGQMAVLDQIEDFAKANNNRVGIVPTANGIDDPALVAMVENLNSTEIEYEKLKSMAGEENPTTVSVGQRIEKLKSDIRQNIQTRKKGLQASRNNIEANSNKYSSTLQTIPQKEKDLLEISRQQAIKNSEYAFLLQKREETNLANASTIADSRIVDKAQADDFPESPKKSFAYLAALIAAMALGVTFVSVKELFSSKVLFRNDIEDHSDTPIVAELANIKMEEPIAINSPNNYYITEQFRHLRASIGLFSNKRLQKKIMVTSSIAGEGKSFVSSNLAVSLAATRKKVVLVDLDLRNPKASEIFKVNAETGVVNYLEHECTIEKIVNKTTYKNLSVIPVGIINSDPTELLLDERLNDLFQYLETQFDYIIIDTAPVDPVADAYLVTEYCDMTLFVVRHGYTPKATIQSLEQSGKLKELKNPVIVFNSVKGRGFFSKNLGHGYGYGNRYNYGNNVYGTKAIGDKKD